MVRGGEGLTGEVMYDVEWSGNVRDIHVQVVRCICYVVRLCYTDIPC
jgi:hypothetical protein